MKDFEREYRKWSMVALISVVILLFTIATIDAFLGFDFSRNMYVMSIVATGCVLALLSLTWIRILNCKLMKSDFWGNDETEEKDKRAEALATVEETPKCISMSDVEMCIRKEGYIPQTEEERVFFKIAGERFEVYYQDEKFTLVKRYCLGDDVDMDLVLRACSIAHDEIFMFRSYVHTYEDGRSILCFEAETYISSVAEMEKYFPQYLNVLLYACERQREIYQQLVEDRTSKIVDKSGSEVREPKVVS